MAETFNQELFDAMVGHQIGVLRFSGSVRNRIWALLDATETDLKALLRTYGGRVGFDTPARLDRLNVLLSKLRETRAEAFTKSRAVWREEMRAFALAEPGFVAGIMASTFPVELAMVLPAPDRLRAIVTHDPFMGKTLQKWAKNVEAADIGRIEDQIKIGLTQGETVPQISRRIVGTARMNGRDGVTQITRRNAAAITRTVASGVGANARSQFAELNKDLAPQELFTATLDSRTTPICRRFDGQLFDVGEGPVLPLHFGERSIYSPVVDGEVIGDRPRRDFTERSLLREYAKDHDIDLVPLKRANLPHGTKGAFDAFARNRMRELTGTVPAKTTYGQWLGRQSAAIQNDILGPTRGKLFRSGGLTVDKFVEYNGTELTLSQLAQRHAAAFKAAGLDPNEYIG